MFKFILSVIVLSLLNTFCNAQQGYTITGVIDGAPDGTKVKMVKWNREEDSTVMVNHTFIFKGILKEPTGASIVLKSTIEGKKQIKQRLFFIENSQMSINATWDNFNNSIMTGSLSDKDVREYELGLKKITKPGTRNTFDTTAVYFTTKFISSHPDSYFSGLQLTVYKSRIPLESVKNLYGILSNKIKSSLFGLSISEYIKVKQQLKLGDIAPGFTLTNISNGAAVTLSDYKGKYLLINFWASWCVPCRAENKSFIQLYQKYHGLKFEILGIGLDQKTNLDKAIITDKLPWTNLYDVAGFDSLVAHLYDISSIPENFLIDPSGKIITINIDFTPDGLSQKLNEVLGK